MLITSIVFLSIIAIFVLVMYFNFKEVGNRIYNNQDNRFNLLKNRLDGFDSFSKDIANIRVEVSSIKSELNSLKVELGVLNQLKANNIDLKILDYLKCEVESFVKIKAEIENLENIKTDILDMKDSIDLIQSIIGREFKFKMRQNESSLSKLHNANSYDELDLSGEMLLAIGTHGVNPKFNNEVLGSSLLKNNRNYVP
ncbi:hypothetical protein [Acinetobacter bereziniae]|uniref:hypothetical protein n=1 Tax=Acinetobacter bereziniae TaxID=106648 RepID=UPI0012504956|nr:hypothetical protein [Acinetobacter bereziniae]